MSVPAARLAGERWIGRCGVGEFLTYEQLQAMSPAEREAAFDASIVWDPETLPERYRQRLEAQTQRVLAREDRLRGQAS